MSDVSCDRASLVEASIDDRLGPSEQASLERHLETCASCSDLRRDLTAIRGTLRASGRAITPLDHQRARLALLRAAATPTPKKRPIALLVAAAVLAPVAVWAAISTVGSVRSSPHDLERPSAATAPTLPAPVPAPPPPPVVSAEPIPTAPPAATVTSTPVTSTPVTSTPSPQRPSASSTAPAPSVAASHAAVASTASQDFAKAMDAIARGDFGAGARGLERFASEHPRDPRVEEAVYLQAIALERAGRIDEAKAAARRYLTSYPSGAHRTQAERLAGD